jgi:LmbE family N-acetylglucosaminyl deacetylase
VTGALVSPEELAYSERHIFLSPHYDDIALSCGGAAALVSQQSREPVIALIFGSEPDRNLKLTQFAESMHRQWGMEAHEVIAGRRHEEAAATAILGARDQFLPFLDAIYRGDRYTNDPQLFGRLADDKEEKELPSKIILSLGLEGYPDDTTLIYAPLATGNHVDHQVAFLAGKYLAEAGWDVLFYEDLPYALKRGALDQRVSEIGSRLSESAIVDVSSVWQAKIDAIMAYPSQLGVIFGYVATGATREEIEAIMRSYAMEVGGDTLAERFWKLA